MSGVPEIDSGRIFAAILASGVTNPKAVEAGSELVDAWVENCAVADQRYRTLGLEVGWFIALDERTYCVGAIDKLAWEPGSENEDPFVFERKTTSSSKTWTVDKWLGDLQAGPQVATYALALQRGTFIFRRTEAVENVVVEKAFNVGFPRVLARAITKSKPPQMWPDANGAWLNLSPQRLNAQWNAFRTEAAAIRARQEIGVVPWQTPGFQCTLTFGFTKRPCSAWSVCHDTLDFPQGGVPLRGLSPGSESVVKYLVETGRILLDRADEYVVLSASSFKSAQQCPELWRQESIGATREDANEAMDTGTVLHAGMAAFDKIMQENGY